MTAIEWTDVTWNPISGCDRVSPGCAHCYALTLAKRLKGMGQPGYQRDGDPRTSGPGFGVTLHPHKLEEPLRWRKPRMVFVNSMSDLFHDEVPTSFIAQVYATMYQAHQHTFQVLTKRPERARAVLTAPDFIEQAQIAMEARLDDPDDLYVQHGPWPPENVWLGVSIENARYTWRADVLREIPAAVRFISAEPLLGSLFLQNGDRDADLQLPRLSEDGALGDAPARGARAAVHRARGRGERDPGALDAGRLSVDRHADRGQHHRAPLDLTGIDWVIVGGESGPGARPMHPDWARELRDACLGVDDHGYLACDACRRMTKPEILDELCDDRTRRGCVLSRRPAFFFKQWGGATPKTGGRELDGRTWDEMPAVGARR